METVRRIAELRDALREVWFHGTQLDNYLDRIVTALDLQDWPDEAELRLANDPGFDPNAHRIRWGSMSWPTIIHEAMRLLTCWHDAHGRAMKAIDDFPHALIDDSRTPIIERRSFKLRHNLIEVNRWLVFTDRQSVGTLLAKLRNGERPANDEWSRQLNSLYAQSDFLFSLEKHATATLNRICSKCDTLDNRLRTPPTEPDAADVLIDLRDYATATDVRTKHAPAGIILDHKRLVRFLKATPGIRTHRPRQNRLLIHLADWTRHTDALVEWYESEPPLNVRGAANRQAEVRRRKEQRK